jgi:HAD superfamily hydrolase (TIGR01509 family)
LEGIVSDYDVITGRLSLQAIHGRLAKSLGLGLSYEAFVDAWVEPYSWPLSGMAALLERLAAQGRRLLLLSNVDEHYWNAIRPMHAELDYFEALLVSCELSLAKPDAEIFYHAAKVAGVPEHRCLFIDDTPRNIDAAALLGFQTHLFTSAESLQADLALRNVAGF